MLSQYMILCIVLLSGTMHPYIELLWWEICFHGGLIPARDNDEVINKARMQLINAVQIQTAVSDISTLEPHPEGVYLGLVIQSLNI